ncbi:MAG: VTT domain-containing protein [Oscillospiraceae bacterium]|nr:VTT domain-containing protein [Oscillospiraceae bacterium]
MTGEKSGKFWKIIGVLIFVLVLLVISVFAVKYLVPACKMLSSEQGRAWIAGFVEKAGILAPVVFVLLMALQIIIAILPGGPLEITAGMLFGGFWGTVLTVMGMLLGTLAVYGLVRKFGTKLVDIVIPEQKRRKFAILENQEKLAFWVFVLFLIPGIPKDLLTYIVPLTDMPARQFLMLSTLARFPAMVASVLMGSSLTKGRYWLCIVIACMAAIAAFAGFYFRNSILKKHAHHKNYKKLNKLD